MGTQVRIDDTLFRTELARNGFKTVAAFEIASGIPRATIDNMLTERNVPNQRTIQAVYDALPKSSVSDLFTIFFDRSVTQDVTVAPDAEAIE